MSQTSHQDTAHLLSAADFGSQADNIYIQDRNTSLFKPLKTVALAVFLILLGIGLFSTSVFFLSFAEVCQDKNETKENPANHMMFNNIEIPLHCSTFVLYLAIFVWMLVWILKIIMDTLHRKHRQSGYLQLYSRVHVFNQIPFNAMALGNAVLLVAITLKLEGAIPDSLGKLPEPFFSLVIQAVLGIEFIVIFIAMAIYIARVAKFNRSHRDPDVFHEDSRRSMPLINNLRSAVGIGPGVASPYSHSLPQLQSVCERQADLIEYLYRRCDVLAGRLYQRENRP